MREENIEKMDFKELRREVMLLRDELAILSRKYEDAIYNLDDDNFSARMRKEKKDMSTQILQTAEQIQLQAEKIDENDTYYLSQFTVTAGKIESAVKAVDSLNGTFNTQITQTGDRIRMVANAAYKNPTEVEDFSVVSSKDTTKVYYDKKTKLYYHHDGYSWVSSTNGNFGSVFEQTEGGFKLKGNVSISGTLITDGSISASKIKTDDLYCTRLYSKTGSSYAKVNSGYGDFGIFNNAASDDAYTNDANCIWGIYVTDAATHIVNFYAYGVNYLGYNSHENQIYPKGNWCFDSCTVTDWGENAPPAVFG